MMNFSNEELEALLNASLLAAAFSPDTTDKMNWDTLANAMIKIEDHLNEVNDLDTVNDIIKDTL